MIRTISVLRWLGFFAYDRALQPPLPGMLYFQAYCSSPIIAIHSLDDSRIDFRSRFMRVVSSIAICSIIIYSPISVVGGWGGGLLVNDAEYLEEATICHRTTRSTFSCLKIKTMNYWKRCSIFFSTMPID